MNTLIVQTDTGGRMPAHLSQGEVPCCMNSFAASYVSASSALSAGTPALYVLRRNANRSINNRIMSSFRCIVGVNWCFLKRSWISSSAVVEAEYELLENTDA